MSKTIAIPTTSITKQAEAFSTYYRAYGSRELKGEAKKIQEKWIDSGKSTKLGIAVLNSRYLVAMKSIYGDVGDDVVIVLNDLTSTKIRATIAEIVPDKEDKGESNYKKYGKVRLNNHFSVVTWETRSRFVASDLTKLKKARVKSVINESKESETSKKAKEVKDKIEKGKVFLASDGKVSPTPSDKWYSGNNNFPYNEASGGNCTWYAYGRFCEIANKWVKCSKQGNAVHFYDKSYFPTCKRGKEPKLGAIVCWSHNGGYEPGHVAVVERIYKNGDIGITNSGWSGGWMGYMRLTKESGYVHVTESNVYGGGWSWDYTFRGFIYNPVEFDSSGRKVSEASEDSQTSIDMRQRISKLYASDNYNFVVTENEEERESPTKTALNLLREKISQLRESTDEAFGGKITELVTKAVALRKLDTIERKLNRKVNSVFDMSRYLVESPFIKVSVGGQEIGIYDGTIDKFPNYVNRLQVRKTNGEINEYTIEVVHQIRVGEDPNLLDRVFSTNQFNKITITYGDSSSGKTFIDTEAMITNVSMNRDYASAKITYTISATSAGNFLTSHIMNFPAVTDKSSNILRKLLYESDLKDEFKSAFPAMASRAVVDSKGLIPTNDGVVELNPIRNADPITYINYLVSNMSNANSTNKTIRNSSYFIFYTDNAGDGAGFEIREVKKESSLSVTSSVYEVTVGYPDDTNVFSFNVSEDKNWSILYNRAMSSNIDEYVYTIEDNGDVNKIYSPNINSADRAMTESEKNWWTFMTEFPITASLTVRGLLRPAFLTNYIKINVVFYGQRHITSGLYTIVEQQDTLDGGGFRTTFSLVRVGDD